tara:strand:+ start:87 stop:452 length:366 start_codon:yes stop_codon:yes gene_type:complete
MPEEIYTDIHKSVMQKLLPIGVAIAERARTKGLNGVFDIFKNSDKPFQSLRSEGESSAQFIRDQLDKVRSGLGNPVVPVDVDINNDESVKVEIKDIQELMLILNDIENRISLLDKIVSDKS